MWWAVMLNESIISEVGWVQTLNSTFSLPSEIVVRFFSVLGVPQNGYMYYVYIQINLEIFSQLIDSDFQNSPQLYIALSQSL